MKATIVCGMRLANLSEQTLFDLPLSAYVVRQMTDEEVIITPMRWMRVDYQWIQLLQSASPRAQTVSGTVNSAMLLYNGVTTSSQGQNCDSS